jgi:hypothetical protein
VVEIRKKSRKIKSGFLMFPKLSAERGNANDCHAIEKQRAREQKKWNLLFYSEKNITAAYPKK